MKTKSGPDSGETPCANIIGYIAKPARTATNVSALTTIRADFTIETSFSRYEPKITPIPLPTPTVKNACPSAAKTTSLLISSGLKENRKLKHQKVNAGLNKGSHS